MRFRLIAWSGAATRAAIASSRFLRWPERRDADVLEIVVGQPAQKLAVNIVGSENLGILGETDPAANRRRPSSVQWALVCRGF